MDASPENIDLLSLNGSGVVIALADTGIDLDHSCFRDSENEIGVPGQNHRKIIHVNTSIDDSDNSFHTQFRHGTHIAGLLVCDPLDGNEDIRSLSHGSKLIFQDIVSENGWVPPNVSLLLEESMTYGAVINSWSWGDNTIEYTQRSKIIDNWSVENPWSLVFIAPGNNGNTVMEPANAINAVSVTASDSEVNGSVWSSSSPGPDVNGRRGVFVTAPGLSVNSSKADGISDSMNSGVYSMGGTSVATPMAASFTALLQEYVEKNHNYTPSGPLLKSMLAISAKPINGLAPDSMQGYGRPSLDSLSEPLFLHDSFRVENWQNIILERGSNYESLIANPWNGSGAHGPFLKENQSWSKYLQPSGGEDIEIVMSYNARGENYQMDDLRLIVNTSDGKFALDDNFSSDGYSKLYTPFFSTPYAHNSTNETTVMVRLHSDYVRELDWIKLEVYAKSVYNGSMPGTIGVEGDALGFALSATGVKEFEQNTAPSIDIISIPQHKSNHSQGLSIEVNITDNEGDGGYAALRLVNSNLTIDLTDCANVFKVVVEIDCEINFSDGLVVMPINNEDWRIQILVVDDNSSIWTEQKSTEYISENFTIWWTSPFEENNDVNRIRDDNSESHQNRALLWGIFGVMLGAIVAAGIMFRRFEKEVFDQVKSPFIEEE